MGILKLAKICAGALVLFFPALLIGAEQTVSSGSDKITLPPRTIEEITVYGQKSLYDIRVEIRETEDQIWGTLNDLIDDEAYKMDCQSRRRYNSYIREYSCELAFLTAGRSDATQQALLASGYDDADENSDYTYFDALSNISMNELDLQVEFAPSYEAYKSMIDDLAAANPELTDAIWNLYYLVDEQKSRKENWWGNLFGRD